MAYEPNLICRMRFRGEAEEGGPAVVTATSQKGDSVDGLCGVWFLYSNAFAFTRVFSGRFPLRVQPESYRA